MERVAADLYLYLWRVRISLLPGNARATSRALSRQGTGGVTLEDFNVSKEPMPLSPRDPMCSPRDQSSSGDGRHAPGSRLSVQFEQFPAQPARPQGLQHQGTGSFSTVL